MSPLPADAVARGLASVNVPGAAIAVISEGRMQWARGYGLRLAGTDWKVDEHTVFGAASVSKAITAVVVLGLVDGGLLDLDGDVRELLGSVPVHTLAPPVDDAPITVRQLLAHRSGILGRGTTPKRSGTGFAGKSTGGGSPRALPHEVHKLDAPRWIGITYQPDTQTSYSGAGYLLVQHVVEAVTGMSFNAVATELFGILDAPAATFEPRPATNGNFAHGHDPDGAPLPGGHEVVGWAAAGGLFTNVTSLAAILDAVVTRDLFGATTTHLSVMQNCSVSRNRKHEFMMGGDNGGYRAIIIGDVQRRTAVAVLTNGRGSAGTKARTELARAALATV